MASEDVLPDIQHGLRVWRWGVQWSSSVVEGAGEQLQAVRWAKLSWRRGGWGRDAAASCVDVTPVDNHQPRQQKGLVVVMVVWTPTDPTGQQNTALPLVVEDQSQQRHHQDEDDSAAYDGIRDAGVVAQPVVQSYEVLAWRLCKEQQ